MVCVVLSVSAFFPPHSTANTPSYRTPPAACDKRQAFLQLDDMCAHQRHRFVNAAGFARTDEIVVVVVPAGEAGLVFEQIDDEAGVRHQQAHLFGQNPVTGEFAIST
ncbi:MULTISPECIES: hypothetical protein [unclassified Beijerinckia]|uniref:hypothetical protein n=1 Tax=unclassified Beijerinckia TaxID=2638183 RepID=UPI001FCCE885|nr:MULTISPECIES: hypothetical protein [unclassified Beijerinckia]